VNEPRRHRVLRARYKVENEYDAAVRQRGSLTVWVTPEAIAAWTPAQTGRRGWPPTYSDVAVKTGLMLRLTFGRPWHQTEGLLGSVIKALLGIAPRFITHLQPEVPLRRRVPGHDRLHSRLVSSVLLEIVAWARLCSPAVPTVAGSPVE
jgi:hypothetical protein